MVALLRSIWAEKGVWRGRTCPHHSCRVGACREKAVGSAACPLRCQRSGTRGQQRVPPTPPLVGIRAGSSATSALLRAVALQMHFGRRRRRRRRKTRGRFCGSSSEMGLGLGLGLGLLDLGMGRVGRFHSVPRRMPSPHAQQPIEPRERSVKG